MRRRYLPSPRNKHRRQGLSSTENFTDECQSVLCLFLPMCLPDSQHGARPRDSKAFLEVFNWKIQTRSGKKEWSSDFVTNVGLRYWKWFATFHLGWAKCNSKQRAVNLGRQLADGSSRCSSKIRNRRKQHDESAHEQFSDTKREKLETNNYSLRTSRRQNNRSTNAKANGLVLFWLAGAYWILERRQ